jgi:hypothetical protein
MTADILGDIDDTLEDWGTAASSRDAMRWHPWAFPPLRRQQRETVRQVCHDTGLDGYAAWLVVADMMTNGVRSPYAHLMWSPGGGPLGRQVSITVDTAAATRALEQVGRAVRAFGEALQPLARAYMGAMGDIGKIVGALAPVAHAIDAGRRPRQHIRCRECHPFANPSPLPVNGREYHRRQRRRSRRNHG